MRKLFSFVIGRLARGSQPLTHRKKTRRRNRAENITRIVYGPENDALRIVSTVMLNSNTPGNDWDEADSL